MLTGQVAHLVPFRAHVSAPGACSALTGLTPADALAKERLNQIRALVIRARVRRDYHVAQNIVRVNTYDHNPILSAIRSSASRSHAV